METITNKDYIIRMIEQFGTVMAQILKLLKAGKQEDAEQLIESSWRSLLGLDVNLVKRLPLSGLVEMLSASGRLDEGKAIAAADLLALEADQYPRALHLYLLAFEQPIVQDRTFTEKIEKVIEKVDIYSLQLETKLLLLNYFEAVGAYARCDDLIFDIKNSDKSGFELVRSKAIALYNRLLELPDEILIKGGLPRDEIYESLAEI